MAHGFPTRLRHDPGRDAAVERAQRQSPALRRLRLELNCEPPWDICEVSLSTDADRYDVRVFGLAGYWPCPTCARQLPCVDHTPTHVFRCLTCDADLYIHVRIPIVDCPVHRLQPVCVPWSAHQDKWSYSRTLPLVEERER